MGAQEFYDTAVRHLPAMDRLRLAKMILDELTAGNGEGLDIRDDWSAEDVDDLTAFSLKQAAMQEGGQEDA